MLDRKNAPEISDINEIKFIEPKIIQLNELVPLYWLNEVPNNTARLDFYFDAGTARENGVIGSLTAGLIFSGTKEKNSTVIHNLLDDHGAYFDVGVTHESALISFYALNDQMLSVFKIFEDAFENGIFPQNEIDELINDRKQKFLVNSEKVGFLAQREFQKNIFHGTTYGNIIELQDYDTIDQTGIIDFFNRFYRNGLMKVVIVGNLPEDEVNYIVNQSKKWCLNRKPEFVFDFSNKQGRVTLEKKGALQSAVRIGKVLFNKQDPDFLAFSVLNTILGDFFGSRLMKNIREDKGYTYGIGSFLSELNNIGYFLIGTEVGTGVREEAIEEIRKEITLLQNELVSQDELDLVKNYLLGQVLKSADGPYAMMDLFLNVETHGLNLDFYNDFIQKIKTIQPEELRELARKYLTWDSMSIVTAG
jgi:predicted Zn-dependent peptidase